MNGFTPTPEQAAAIESRQRSILLEAGAGSGKTAVLVERYCARIAEDELSPGRILAFTFTEKAGAQLSDRIQRRLRSQAQAATDPGLAARLREAAHSLSGAWVMTIHAFCRRVLAGHAVAAGLDPEFAVFDETVALRLRRAAFDTAIERFLNRADPEARETVVAAYGITTLRELILDAYSQLRSHGSADPTLPQPPQPDPEADLIRLQRAAEALLGGDCRRHAPSDAKAREALEIAARREEWLQDPERHSAALERLTDLGTDSKVSERQVVEKARRAAVASLIASGPGGEAYGLLAELLRGFGRAYDSLKQQRAGLDFDDLQLRTLQLLTEHRSIGDRYRERFDEIMVDEFQDTSPSQVALIEALRGEQTALFEVGDEFQAIYGFRHADVGNFRAERRRFDQSTDASVLPLRGNFRSQPEILGVANACAGALIPSFRPLTAGAEAASQPQPLAELLMTYPDGWQDAANRPQPPRGESLRRGAEAEAVADRLAQLAREGVPRGDMVVLLRTKAAAGTYAAALERRGLRPFVVGGRGYWSGRDVGDGIALLRAVANPLDDEGLLGALASPACAASPDTLWLLRRAAGRGRAIWPVLEQFCGEPPAGPDSDPAAAGWLAAIDPEDGAALSEFHQQLTRLHREAGALSLTALVERSFALTGLDLATLTAPDGPRRWAGLRKLIRIAADFEAAEGRDLRALLDHGELEAESDAEGEAVIAAEGHDGVRLMTVHAAKGLEFPVVAVPELGRSPARRGGRGPLLRLAPDGDGGWKVGLRLRRIGHRRADLYDYERLEQEQQQTDLEEEMRLFYVAMTRAERHLILSGVCPARSPSLLKPSTPLLHRLIAELGLSLPDPDRPETGDRVIELAAPEPRAGLEASFRPARLKLSEHLPLAEPQAGEVAAAAGSFPASAPSALPAARASSVAADGDQLALDPAGPPPSTVPFAVPPPPLDRLSFSSLSAAEAPGEAGPPRPPQPVGPGAAGRERGEEATGEPGAAAAFGEAVHAILEGSLTRSRRRWRPLTRQRITAELDHRGLVPSQERVARAEAMIEGWLGSDLCAQISGPGTTLRAEVPLILRPLRDDETTVSGIIDLLAESPDQPPMVVDYKTNSLAGRDPEDLMAGYELQSQIYALAVARATASPLVRVGFVFLERPQAPVLEEFGAAELRQAELGLAERIVALRAQLAGGSNPAASSSSFNSFNPSLTVSNSAAQ